MQRKSSDAEQSQPSTSDNKTTAQDSKPHNKSPRLQGFLSTRNIPPIQTAPSALTPSKEEDCSAPKRGATPSS